MAKKYKKRYMVRLVLHGSWSQYCYVSKKISNFIGSIADNAARNSLDTLNGSLHYCVGRVRGTDCYIKYADL